MAQNAHVSPEPFEHPEPRSAPAHAVAPRAASRAVSQRPAASQRRGGNHWSPPSEGRTSLWQNPILERELRSRWRRPLTYIVLFAYAAALSWVAWQLSGTAIEQNSALASGYGSDQAAALPGTALFRGSVTAQVLVALWASALLCAPVIARERELKMLPELILANLSPAQIVRGKWLATLGFAAILLLIPLPLQALAFLMGGVSPAEWISAALLQVGAMILGSAMGLWCSALSSRVAQAMSVTCLGAVALSIPLSCGLAAMAAGPWVGFLMAVACVLVALPLLAGAQNSVQYLPLEPSRPQAVEQPASPAQSAARPAAPPSAQRPAYAARLSASFDGEAPSLPLSARGPSRGAGAQAAQIAQGRAQAERARAAELEAGRALGQRRESWVFSLLRALRWHNPLVWREMRVRLRQPFFDVSTLLSLALCLLALPALGASLFAPNRSDSLAIVLPFWLLCGVACALGAAQGFTREREQRMLEGLLLSTLSPLSIVVGKVAAPILLVLHTGALPLGLFASWTLLWSVMNGANVAFIALLGCACFALCGAACGTWLSFWCRTSSVSAMGSLALFGGLLAAPLSLSNMGPQRFQEASAAFWNAELLAPLSRFDGSAGFWSAGLFLCSLLLAVSLGLLAHITIALRPQALEREGRSLLHTDLTRNLR